ncbi:4-(cytidine 5'-diphospho)-2-C-methyl-D-erythritol kinase [Nocardioides sp.]|uniref:4-(cytidine 5'-diphospho)-2-C-methyl-D-erythritol kinase n=1 Tax=Nocardioides sp. TaxID=35761 RepID=UPI001A2F6243|nr:4-(cytidine 5'-diphospho)-2-C-methyl-D-erythritol kinase [Nocardioides sp.]MBJ7357040.1 4-(cytidine 5'-diphospho)-2-C-methyl-D-erythritol kinase [Nocardioides sp.]
MTYTVRAPAKINLHLGVGAPREDGFHPLLTVYQAVGICDDVTVSRSAGWSLGVTVPDWIDPDLVPDPGDNIVDRAARLLADHHGIEATAEVSIAKSIPMAGGMAGGSADAAAALVALDRLWGVETSDDDLLRIAAELGSDVPFALLGGTALGTGRGELVERVRDDGTWWWVAVVDPEGMSTPAVYRHFDELNPDADPEPPRADDLLEAIDTGDLDLLAASLRNDLQEAAFDLRPSLSDVIDRGERAGALRGLVSGSGPTCVFLAESADSAREVAAQLTGDGHDVVLVTHGPVAGAHVVTYV